MIAWWRSNDGVRSCPPYSTSSTANTAVPASPKCGNSFVWSRLRAMRSQKRIAMSAILAAPLVGIAVLATIGQPHSTKLATFTEPARLQPADGSRSGSAQARQHPLGRHGMPLAARGCGNFAGVQLSRHLSVRHAGKLSEYRSQLFGAL